jgi:hypothetical protein
MNMIKFRHEGATIFVPTTSISHISHEGGKFRVCPTSKTPDFLPETEPCFVSMSRPDAWQVWRVDDETFVGGVPSWEREPVADLMTLTSIMKGFVDYVIPGFEHEKYLLVDVPRGIACIPGHDLWTDDLKSACFELVRVCLADGNLKKFTEAQLLPPWTLPTRDSHKDDALRTMMTGT